MASLLSIAKRGLARLLRRFPMDVSIEKPYALEEYGYWHDAIVLEPGYPREPLRINIEPSGCPVVEFGSCQAGVDVRYLVARRDPTYLAERLPLLGRRPGQRGYAADLVRVLDAVAAMLLKFCQPLLNGKYLTSIRPERYRDADRLLKACGTLPATDPLMKRVRNFADAKRGLGDLLRRYRMQFSFTKAGTWILHPGSFDLVSAACKVRLWYEYGPSFLDIACSANGFARRYSLAELVGAQDPTYCSRNGIIPKYFEDEQECYRFFKALAEMLEIWCRPLLLRGRIPPRMLAAYDELRKASSEFPYAYYEFDRDDPIWIKMSRGDFTWIDDYRARLEQEKLLPDGGKAKEEEREKWRRRYLGGSSST